jgi:hypothetical protein
LGFNYFTNVFCGAQNMPENKKALPAWKDEVILVHASLRSEDQIIDDIQFWQNQDEQARSAAAWQIAKEVHLLCGKSEDELVCYK